MANQVKSLADVEFGTELPAFDPDTTLDNVRRFGKFVGWGGGRFTDHEAARKEGFPGAIVPGVMSQGFLGAMINRWAPTAQIQVIDTIFRAPVLVDHKHTITGVVTNIEEDDGTVEIDVTIKNEADETRVLGTATVKVPT